MNPTTGSQVCLFFTWYPGLPHIPLLLARSRDAIPTHPWSRAEKNATIVILCIFVSVVLLRSFEHILPARLSIQLGLCRYLRHIPVFNMQEEGCRQVYDFRETTYE